MINMPLNLKAEDFNVQVNFEITNVDSLLEQIPTETLYKVVSNRNKDFVTKTYHHSTTEQLGLLLLNREDKSDVLVNFDVKELLLELYRRDADLIVGNMEDRQINQMVDAILSGKDLPHEAETAILEFVKDNYSVLSRCDLENVFQNSDAKELTQLAVEQLGCCVLLTAIADHLR
jgi:uncharacterized membrane protein YgaE (UPF0421/DUF939 family)